MSFNHFDYVRHFLNSCTRILGLESFPSRVEHNGRCVFCCGVDVDVVVVVVVVVVAVVLDVWTLNKPTTKPINTTNTPPGSSP